MRSILQIVLKIVTNGQVVDRVSQGGINNLLPWTKQFITDGKGYLSQVWQYSGVRQRCHSFQLELFQLSSRFCPNHA